MGQGRDRVCADGCQLQQFAIEKASKKFLSTVSFRFGETPTLTNFLQSFCEFKAHFFGEEGQSFRQETTVHGRQSYAVDRNRAWPGLLLWASFSFFLFVFKSSAGTFL